MKNGLILLLALMITACGTERLPPPAENPPAQVEETTEPPEVPETPLTAEELAQANKAFSLSENPEKALELSCFFTSAYEDVTELDFEEFLRYYFSGSSDLWDEDAEEFQALAGLKGWSEEDMALWGGLPSGLPVPVHRIPRAAVDQTLEAYAGITAADLKNTEGVLYLPDYDAYYNFTSDYGPGWFEAAEGVRAGDVVRLRSEPSWWTGGGEVVRELTLREAEGRWLIQSFTLHPAENGGPS
ncbi:hypothetical protein AALC17_16665 [Oscillospiraceae bacterium 38-13]|jgi:hypothetical protein